MGKLAGDLRLGLLHFLAKQNAQKAHFIHGSSSWQPDEWTSRKKDGRLLFLARQRNVPWLAGRLAGWLPACLCIYGIGTTHTDTHTLAEEVVCGMLHTLWHWHWENCGSRHTVRQAATEPVFLACRLARATLRISNAQQIALFAAAIWHQMIHAVVSLMRLRDRSPWAAVIASRKLAVSTESTVCPL